MSTSPDYDRLMQANLARVFGERDASRRLKAIAQLYAPDATLYEPDALATGHAAISQAVARLLSSLPPNFAFTAIGPAVGPLQTVLVDREVVVGLGAIGAAGDLSHRPPGCRDVRGLKLYYSAMRKLNEEGPRLAEAAKESDDFRSAVRSTHIGFANLPDGIGAPESGECVGIVIIHGVGELSGEVAYVGLGDHSLQSVGNWLTRR